MAERDESFLHRLADVAAREIMPFFRSPLAVENKRPSGFDPVTAADRAAEAAMRRLIAATFPADGVMGEEEEPTGLDAEHIWYLDPIDGTRSFISGVPVWGTLVGLMSDGRPTLGLMAQPFTGERFTGNGRVAGYDGPGGRSRLATRPCPQIGAATLFTTSPDLFDAAEAQRFQAVSAQARLTRFGADCYAFCMLAAGHVDIVIEAGLKPYDIAALIPIVEGAGGRVTTWGGAPAGAGGQILACGDPALHDRVLALLSA